jgi:hypothetical protein
MGWRGLWDGVAYGMAWRYRSVVAPYLIRRELPRKCAPQATAVYFSEDLRSLLGRS